MVVMESSKTPLPWTDQVKTHDMRTESDAIFFFSGNLMARAGVQLYFVRATGDFITPDAVPLSCLLSVRVRESCEVRHLNLDATADGDTIGTFARYSFLTVVLPGMVLPNVTPKPGGAPVKTEPREGPKNDLPKGIDATR